MKNLASIIFLISLSLGFFVLAYIIFRMQYPSTCKFGCSNVCDSVNQKGCTPSWLNGPDCSSVKETTLDPTIPSPIPVPYITSFTFSEGAGSPLCKPMWYSFRYVRNIDGMYGPLSPWSGQDISVTSPTPIYAGASTFPCPPNNCSNISSGEESCSFNEPTLSLISTVQVDPTLYTLNVHRQIAIDNETFDPNNEGQVVGSFVVGTFNNGITAMFTDVMFNPNVTTSSTCC